MSEAQPLAWHAHLASGFSRLGVIVVYVGLTALAMYIWDKNSKLYKFNPSPLTIPTRTFIPSLPFRVSVEM